MKSISTEFELPVTSSSFTSEVTLNHYQGEVILTFNYEDDDKEKQFRLTVHDVYMSRFVTDACATPFQIGHAYEQLIVIEASDWIADLYKQALANDVVIEKEVKHFVIYIPDFGSCEFAALKASHQII